jgi:hypothetical protein
MSITRLQQARQMYAMGQRVGRIAFGGGGSYVSGGGSGRYQGGSAAPGSAEAATGGGGSSYKDGGGYVSDRNPTGTLTGKDYQKAEEEYLTDVGRSQLQNLYDTGVPKINAPFNLPFTPLTTALNVAKPIRNFTLRKNIDYFKGLDQTQYPQTLQGYKDYMKDKLDGKITASGNFIPIDGGVEEGIMEIYKPNDMLDVTDSVVEEETTPFKNRFELSPDVTQAKGIERLIQDEAIAEMIGKLYT